MVKALGLSMVATIISVLGWDLYQRFHNRRGQPFGEPYVCNQESDHDVGDGLEGANIHGSEGSSADPILGPQHKIFLSHSGAQKEFVEHLCKAFEDRCHYPFFDMRDECLPKGEKFPKLIVQAAEQCEMLIVVVSNEYFMSKWPMIELSAFVKAHKLHHGSNHGLKILPLFYGLSVSDLDNKGMQKKWFQKWKTLAKADPKKRIDVNDWKNAFQALMSFNGLPFDTKSGVVAYEDKIVSYVCKSIAPDIRWDDSHVQGKSSICKVIGEKIEGIGCSKKYNVKVVGIYGVGGIGKTTICKTLCNELSSKYEGRVCHIEFPSVPTSDSKELLQKVLRDLTRKSMEVIQQLNEGECKHILRESLSKQRTFLAIDNISDNHQTIQHGKTFLEFCYHPNSLVVVTARSQGALKLLGLDGDVYLEMPDLEEVDAMNLFLHHATSGKQFFEDGEKHDVMTCVRSCHFSKGNREGHHYHPLALEALGLQLGCYGDNPSLWVKHLPCVRAFNFFPGENPVFDILRSSFDSLAPKAQALFMDVGCFSKRYNSYRSDLRIKWLCFIHKQDEEELALQLEYLKRKGLLQDVDLRSRRISMHDLYLEFAKLEAMGSFNESTNLMEQMWVYMEDGDLTELESIPEGGCWPKLIRVTIIRSSLGPYNHCGIVGQMGGLEGIKWDHFSNVEVLQLVELHWGHGALNLEGLVRLRSLELLDICELDRIEGLEKLKHLTYFVWKSCKSWSNSVGAHIMVQLPLSLKHLDISHMGMESDLLVQCHKLSKLRLFEVEAHSLDLSNCWSLESMSLWNIRKLQTVLGLGASRPSILQSLKVSFCKDLVDIPGIDHLIGLKKLDIGFCPKYKLPSLCALSKLQVLHILGQRSLVVPGKDYFPCQLRELRWTDHASSEGLNFIGFNQLEVLHLKYSDGLTSLAKFGDLPALSYLDLGFCEHLVRLPDLSASKNLKSLILDGCSALELHEKDIQMLSELPLLGLVAFSCKDGDEVVNLDLARRKVLVKFNRRALVRRNVFTRSLNLQLGDNEWEEQNLDDLPIKIGRSYIFQERWDNLYYNLAWF